MSKKKILIILGPTASGKTELALRLAKKFNGFVISADSRQLYKEMNIGTAKPKGRILNFESGIKNINTVYSVQNIPHFMLDIINPNKLFTLADWLKITKQILNSKILNSKFQIPIICGGTGLYISALVDNYDLPQGKVDLLLRKKLNKLSLLSLQKKLKKLDLATYETIDQQNKIKIIRALEYVLTNQRIFKPKTNQKSSYKFLQIGLNIPREKLYQRINQRVDKMIKNGLIEEVKRLTKKYSANLPSMSGIGYKQIQMYLNNKIDKTQAIEMIKTDTRHYAKRQLTWFKRNKNIIWIKKYHTTEKLVKNFLQN